MKPTLILLAALLLVQLAAVNAAGQAPDGQTLLRHAAHLTEPARGPEFVMPVGSGDLAAMVSFDTALQMHLSKSDWLGRPLLNERGDTKTANMSPGHVTLALGNLAAADIRRFDQFIDFRPRSVIVRLDTAGGSVELEVFGDMTAKALLIHVRDERRVRGTASAKLVNWRKTMQVTARESLLTGEEIHRMTCDGRPVTDPGKVPAEDCLYNLGLGVATVNRVLIHSERGRTLRLVTPFASCHIALNGQSRPGGNEKLTVLPTQPGDSIELTSSR